MHSERCLATKSTSLEPNVEGVEWSELERTLPHKPGRSDDNDKIQRKTSTFSLSACNPLRKSQLSLCFLVRILLYALGLSSVAFRWLFYFCTVDVSNPFWVLLLSAYNFKVLWLLLFVYIDDTYSSNHEIVFRAIINKGLIHADHTHTTHPNSTACTFKCYSTWSNCDASEKRAATPARVHLERCLRLRRLRVRFCVTSHAQWIPPAANPKNIIAQTLKICFLVELLRMFCDMLVHICGHRSHIAGGIWFIRVHGCVCEFACAQHNVWCWA